MRGHGNDGPFFDLRRSPRKSSLMRAGLDGEHKVKRPRPTDWSFQAGDCLGSVGLSDSAQTDASGASKPAASDDTLAHCLPSDNACCRYSIEFGCCDCIGASDVRAAGWGGSEVHVSVGEGVYYDPSVATRVIDDYVKQPVQTRALELESACAPGFMDDDSHVRLNVYHVGQHAPLRNMLYNLLPSTNLLVGAFHTGVEVWGREWWFGFHERAGWGIASCRPRGHVDHQFYAALDLGVTSRTATQVS